MPEASRRSFLAATAALPLVPPALDAPAQETVARDLDRYIGFGSKQAGGAGDNGCGDWMAGELERAGYAVTRQPVSVPWFEAEACDLSSRSVRAAVWPHPIVVPTDEDITARLVRVDGDGNAAAALAGAIALVDLPCARWSTALAKGVRVPVEAAFAAGARATVVVTNGPTGEIIALNTDGRAPMFAGPVALIAPKDAGAFLAAAARGEAATLRITGSGGRRPAFNFVGRIDRGRGRWLVVSTPRSGWFTCAGERGGGIAA